MSTIVYALTETNGQTGFVNAVFFDEEMAIEVARSNADARVGRCVTSDARLAGGNRDSAAYAIRVENIGTSSDITIVHVASGLLDDCRWSVREYTVVEPAVLPAQTFALAHLPAIHGRLAIKTLDDRIEDGFGVVRTNLSPPVEVAVIHDGSDHGVSEAANYERLLAIAPVMLRLITDALGAWAEQFDGDDSMDRSVSGSDRVDWLSAWRLRARSELATQHRAPASVP
jgi:hypothetical protein